MKRPSRKSPRAAPASAAFAPPASGPAPAEALPTPYDPNSESDELTKGAALHWELLRRNTHFRAVAAQWISDPDLRPQHAATEDYHNQTCHFPRCALYWMLDADARVQLAHHQVDQGNWFLDSRFNFGPIVVAPKINWLALRPGHTAGAFHLRPLPDAPPPLRLEQPWPATPAGFRQQFTLSVHGDRKFDEHTISLGEVGVYLSWAAARLLRNDTPGKLPEIIRSLDALGTQIRRLAEFHRLFAIPNARTPTKRLDEHLAAIRKTFQDAGLLEDRFLPHASWLGTERAWHWFLIAEQRYLSADDPAAMYLLAREFSEALRQERYEGKSRRDARPEGFRQTPVPSRTVKNRRQTVASFIRQIERWRDHIYPPACWAGFSPQRPN